MNSNLKHIFNLYISGIIIYGVGLLFVRYGPYYATALSTKTQQTLLFLFVTYLIICPVYYLKYATETTVNKPFIALRALRRSTNTFVKSNEKYHLSAEEKTSFLFILVKLFFLPLMINFLYGNISLFTQELKTIHWYSLALSIIFMVDTFIFVIGYSTESRKLNNLVRSVEPTLFGWIVALICYPPFNSIVGNYIPWGANDYAFFWNDTLTTIAQIFILALFSIYLWASIALGTKASNLTNRGIATKFPYSLVRHPAYISKNLVWWLTLLPVLNWKFALGMSFWTIIYYCRALTEERHLRQDPEYQDYCKKVKWRFIPYLY